jgi:ABC-type branched-subunit amino acid transport system ATPase component
MPFAGLPARERAGTLGDLASLVWEDDSQPRFDPTSILALLQRFYEPTAGQITIGGVDVRAIEMQTARGMMGYVSQEAVLFQGTVRFNLCVSSSLVHSSKKLGIKMWMISWVPRTPTRCHRSK